ncbi:MAG TPA: SDR family oxidoreductase [Candidatus Binatia bacterium]|jgi:NAD(P)-dependent dehydrogenase (short-subunit alcohol dehydrogenase family)|nr:SDR family oxidoreductase [Candidatus Binatia bacterium]
MSTPVTVITGASRGIGKQLAVDLARAGWDVVCAARSSQSRPSKLPGTVDDTAAAVTRAGRRAMAVGLDVQDEDAVAALAERVYATWGRCDLLINNAAIAPPRPALEDSIRRWRLAVDVNLNGPFYLSWHLGRRMAHAGGGRVINVSSAAAVMPSFGRPSYTSTKLALEGLTESLGYELAGRVAVNCIRIDIPIWSEGFEATLPRDFDTSGFEDAAIMSDAVLWLARQDLSLTGKILTLTELRRQGIVRPETSHRGGAG